MINQRIIYFISLLAIYIYVTRIEHLDIDALIKEKTESTMSNIDIRNTLSEEDINVNDLTNTEDITNFVNTKVQQSLDKTDVNQTIKDALEKTNVVNIDVDGETIENIEKKSEGTVEVTIGEEEVKQNGKGMDIGIIIFLLILAAILLKK